MYGLKALYFVSVRNILPLSAFVTIRLADCYTQFVLKLTHANYVIYVIKYICLIANVTISSTIIIK